MGWKTGPRSSCHQTLICICECQPPSYKSLARGESLWLEDEDEGECKEEVGGGGSDSTNILLSPLCFSSFFNGNCYLEDSKGLIESSGLTVGTLWKWAEIQPCSHTTPDVFAFLSFFRFTAAVHLLDTTQLSYKEQCFQRVIEFRKKKKTAPFKHRFVQQDQLFAQPLRRSPVLH